MLPGQGQCWLVEVSPVPIPTQPHISIEAVVPLDMAERHCVQVEQKQLADLEVQGVHTYLQGSCLGVAGLGGVGKQGEFAGGGDLQIPVSSAGHCPRALSHPRSSTEVGFFPGQARAWRLSPLRVHTPGWPTG